MARHPIDHDRRPTVGTRAKQYARIDRETGDGLSDPKVKAMTRRTPEEHGDGARIREYLKIDRGSQA